jgi:hypothetical protein
MTDKTLDPCGSDSSAELGVCEWGGREGYAERQSRDVELACRAVIAAKASLFDALKAAYPEGCWVEVVHHRGRFFGIVTGWDAEGSRIAVRNERSQKVNTWWSAHVQRC